MSKDDELERLKARRLAEMQKNISGQSDAQSGEAPKVQSPRELLVGRLGYRGAEVLGNAESQFPGETRIMIEKLGELIASGEIDEDIDGGKLLLLFRSVGLHIRMQTRINVEQDGKFVSLSDKISGRQAESGE